MLCVETIVLWLTANIKVDSLSLTRQLYLLNKTQHIHVVRRSLNGREITNLVIVNSMVKEWEVGIDETVLSYIHTYVYA